MSVLPYSYHTFLFPFVWNNGGETSITDFLECINTDYWKSSDWIDGKIPPYRYTDENIEQELNEKLKNELAKNKFFTDYQAYEYFMPNARNLLYNCDSSDSFVFNYDLTINGEPIRIKPHKQSKKSKEEKEKYDYVSNAKYIITKHIEDQISKQTKCIQYTLQINAIRLRIFNSGVAILKLETEFHGHKTIDGTKVDYSKTLVYERIDDFNSINEYGRRINLPFIGKVSADYKYSKNSLVADEVKIELDGYPKEFQENFADTIIRMNMAENPYKIDKKLSLTYIANHIKKLIDIESNRHVTSNKSSRNGNNDDIFIYPIIDDRMYVCAMLRNNFISECIKKKDSTNKDYKIYSDDYVSKLIYTIGFIETDCSCQSMTMRRDILKRCVYDRWIDYGTIDVITHHSVVRITCEETELEANVINPFLLQYIQMAEIALAQRATILALFDRVDNATAGIKDGNLDNSLYNKIQAIQRDYVKAQNQIFLGDVTVQEQGVEEFRMMLNELYLERTISELDEQIKDAYELANGYIDEKTNHQINLITKLGAGIAVSSIGIDLISMTSSEFPSILLRICNTIGSLAILAGIIITAHYWKNKHKK